MKKYLITCEGRLVEKTTKFGKYSVVLSEEEMNEWKNSSDEQKERMITEWGDFSEDYDVDEEDGYVELDEIEIKEQESKEEE